MTPQQAAEQARGNRAWQEHWKAKAIRETRRPVPTKEEKMITVKEGR